jgi:GH18 family chitinase
MDSKSNPNGFGGIMQWSTSGDTNGSFSNSISSALGY